MITSAGNSKIKLVRALLGKPKERRAQGAFVAEGVRLLEEALLADWPFRFILHGEELSERAARLLERAAERKVEVEQVDASLMRSLGDTESSQGLLAVLDEHELPLPPAPDLVLIPDSIRDPGNLGTLLRSAEAAGAQVAWLPPETVDPFAPKVVRSGMGAHFRLPLRFASWDELRERLAGMQVYLAEMGGAACWDVDFRVPLALIIGGEAAGATPAARQLATRLVSIPMVGQAESLNAGVAGAILLYEVLRQRAHA